MNLAIVISWLRKRSIVESNRYQLAVNDS